MRHAVLLCVLAAVAIALVPQATAREHAAKAAKVLQRHMLVDTHELRRILGRIERNRDETWRWQKVMHRPRTPYAASAGKVRSLAYVQWVRDLWLRRSVHAKQQALHPPHKAQWLCIHHYEGSWSDPNAPYYGGLQMDVEFQQTYGGDLLHRKGTADHWTPLEQMWVAERAYKTRGFWPWPNTARYCGLI